MNNLIYLINQAIEIEYDSKNKEIDEILNLPLEEKILKGETLINLKIHLIDAKTDFITVGPTRFLMRNNDENLLSFKKVSVLCENNNSKFNISFGCSSFSSFLHLFNNHIPIVRMNQIFF